MLVFSAFMRITIDDLHIIVYFTYNSIFLIGKQKCGAENIVRLRYNFYFIRYNFYFNYYAR